MTKRNIAGCCQQTSENKKIVDITQQCFAFTPQANFPALNLKVIRLKQGYLLKSFLLYTETPEHLGTSAHQVWTENKPKLHSRTYFFYLGHTNFYFGLHFTVK